MMKQGPTAKEAARLLAELRENVLAGDEKAFEEHSHELGSLVLWQPEREGLSGTLVDGLLALFGMPEFHSFVDVCGFFVQISDGLAGLLSGDDAARLLESLVRWLPSFSLPESTCSALRVLAWTYPDERGLEALTRLRRSEETLVLIFLPDALETLVQLCDDRGVQEGAVAILSELCRHPDEEVRHEATYYHEWAVKALRR